MAVSPTNSAVVYAGMINGGLFRSVDGGNTWNGVTLPVFNPVVFSIVFDPATPSTVFVGTGNGVFRSADSGTTWTPINNFGGLAFPPNVRALAIDPATPLTMYAGTFGNGIFKSTNGGFVWSPINNGLTGNHENNFVNAIAIDPFNSQTIYSGHGSSGGPGIINKSVNGGDSWAPMHNGVPNFVVNSIVADRTTANTLYAATAGGGVVKTTNGGTNWSNANIGLWNSNVSTLVAHASNSAIMFAGSSGGTSQ